MRGKGCWIVIAIAVLLPGCAGAGTFPASSPKATSTSVTIVASAAPAAPRAVPVPVPTSRLPAPAQSGEASCTRGARPIPSLDPSASFDINDPRQRARRALAEQYTPAPRRGVVRETAVPGAEACIYALKLHFSLLMTGSRTVPDDEAIRAALSSAGLTKIVVRPGAVFAASTGAACVYGTVTASGPAFTIGPSAADDTCRP
jgi:hypothetical protein